MHRDMSERVQRASVRQAPNKSCSLQCFSCGCKDDMCYVVLKKKSVYKMRKQGRGIKCPVHCNQRHTSTHALKFYAIIQELALEKMHGIVWDWFDVPDSDRSNHKMHIDATVFCGETCFRFEIDGEAHFSNSGTSRLPTDEEKDNVLRECGVGILRLHYLDVDTWAQSVLSVVERQHSTVEYTASYKYCLHPEEYKYILEK